MIWVCHHFHPSHIPPLLEFPLADVFFLFHLLCHISPPQRQAKYSENKMKCTKARNDYLLNLAATNAVVAKYYIHDVSDMIDVSMSMFASISLLGSLMLIQLSGAVTFLTICSYGTSVPPGPLAVCFPVALLAQGNMVAPFFFR